VGTPGEAKDGATWQDPGVVFISDVTVNELATAFALSGTVTVNAADAAVAVNLAGLVPSGKTLRIAGPGGVKINSGDLTVKNGGNLEVLSGGALIADTSKTLIVDPTATVTVKSGGALGSAAAINWTVSSAATLIKAKTIGDFEYTHQDTLDNYGVITYENGTAYYTEVVADVAAAKAFAVSDNVYLKNTVATGASAAILGDLTSSRSLIVEGNFTLPTGGGAQTIAGALSVIGNFVQGSGGNAVTVDVSLNVTGTYAAITAIANTTQNIGGAGSVSIGTLTVASSSGTATGFKISNSVTATNVNITGFASGPATLTIDAGALQVNGTLTFTEASGANGILAGASAGTVTFAAGSGIAEVGSVTHATAFPGITYTGTSYTFAGQQTLTWDSIDWVNVDLDTL
jgi:hypothetical protein